ncbi:hypothetical protein IWW48_002104 [Coemansia sp. RSA 1200]|nr:hypothetical protein IWW48_002104 [Coemansia sp. RSA 1200]
MADPNAKLSHQYIASLIEYCSQIGCITGAGLLKQIELDAEAYPWLFQDYHGYIVVSYAKLGLLGHSRRCHREGIKALNGGAASDMDWSLCIALLRSFRQKEARVIFDRLAAAGQANSTMYGKMIKEYTLVQLPDVAFALFDDACRAGLRPDYFMLCELATASALFTDSLKSSTCIQKVITCLDNWRIPAGIQFFICILKGYDLSHQNVLFDSLARKLVHRLQYTNNELNYVLMAFERLSEAGVPYNVEILLFALGLYLRSPNRAPSVPYSVFEIFILHCVKKRRIADIEWMVEVLVNSPGETVGVWRVILKRLGKSTGIQDVANIIKMAIDLAADKGRAGMYLLSAAVDVPLALVVADNVLKVELLSTALRVLASDSRNMDFQDIGRTNMKAAEFNQTAMVEDGDNEWLYNEGLGEGKNSEEDPLLSGIVDSIEQPAEDVNALYLAFYKENLARILSIWRRFEFYSTSPDIASYSILLGAYTKAKEYQQGEDIVSTVISMFGHELHISCQWITLRLKQGNVKGALHIFDALGNSDKCNELSRIDKRYMGLHYIERSAFHFFPFVKYYLGLGKHTLATKFLLAMHTLGFKGTTRMYCYILMHAAALNNRQLVVDIVHQMVEFDVPINAQLTEIIKSYSELFKHKNTTNGPLD